MESQSRNSIIPIIILTALVTAIFVGGMVYIMSNSSKFATSGDLDLLQQEVRGLKQELKGEMADLRSEMNNNEVVPAPFVVQPVSQKQPKTIAPAYASEVCIYNEVAYQPGQSHYDGCNSHTCQDDGTFASTERACGE